MLSLTTILLLICFLLLWLLNFHFYFLFYVKKNFFLVQYYSSLLAQTIYYLLICHKPYWDFLRHVQPDANLVFWILSYYGMAIGYNLVTLQFHLLFFFFNTKFFLCHYKKNFFLNSFNLSFTWALSIKLSSYFFINKVMLLDFVLDFETQTRSQILELI